MFPKSSVGGRSRSLGGVTVESGIGGRATPESFDFCVVAPFGWVVLVPPLEELEVSRSKGGACIPSMSPLTPFRAVTAFCWLAVGALFNCKAGESTEGGAAD